jgi:hypothetical protein
MAILKKVGVLSVAKMFGAIYAVLGFILGFFMFLLMGVIGGASLGQGGGMIIGTGIFMWIIYTVMLAVCGFVSSAIMAYLYNYLVPKIGGVEVEIK